MVWLRNVQYVVSSEELLSLFFLSACYAFFQGQSELLLGGGENTVVN